jgi:hypothetical protein
MMEKPQDQMGRRRIFKTAGAAGALAAAAAALPFIKPEEQTAEHKAAPEGSAGYRVSEHVLRYYETTRI